MSGPLGQVAPKNDAFGGGTLTAAATPTAVSGSFGGPGASGFPGPGTPNILSARNNSGSNVRIPYARLVPMRGKQSGPDNDKIWASIPDINLRNGLNGRQVGQEYDGLEQAELAWIMGRKYIDKSGNKAGEGNPLLTAMGASAHGLGMGKGVDRLQRLCYQGYMEAYFRAVFGQQVVNLGALEMCSATNTFLCEELGHYAGILGGASVIGSVDVAYASERLFGNNRADKKLTYAKRTKNWEKGTAVKEAAVESGSRGGNLGLASGIFTMDKGPFLRGKIVEDAVQYVTDPMAKGGAKGDRSIAHAMSRNFGDELAFEALFAHMKARSFFDWTPDGMVLSKLESPSGDAYGSMELDARQAQLYNIAIQGPAIAKTWTGDYKQQVMPMDRVFVAVVADVVTTLGGAGEGIGTKDLSALHGVFAESMAPNAPPGSQQALAAAIQAAQGKVEDGTAGEYETLVKKLFDETGRLAGASTDAARNAAQLQVDNAREGIANFFKHGDTLPEMKAWMQAFEEAASGLRRGELGASRCVMTNFRMMRVTSAYLSQYSHFVPGKPESRCGLHLGTQGGGAAGAGQTVVGEYIVGAWHIGTVLDNAASRSTIGSSVRVAPASMAVNINVNIEWWSGDKLYRNYMDVEGQVLQRDATTRDNSARLAGVDVSEADMVEKTSWF